MATAPSSAPDRSRDTRERLLDTAEELFAERGFEGTSMRALAAATGTSVSAAHYHFGSKEALLRETLRRRLEPVGQRRIQKLDELQREAGDRPLSLEAILDAFLRPALEARSAAGPEAYRNVAARLYSDPPELVSSLKRDFFAPIYDRFLAALRQALPDQPPEQVALRFQLSLGSMIHVIGGHLGDPDRDVSEPLPWSDAELLEHMVAHAAAGLRVRSARLDDPRDADADANTSLAVAAPAALEEGEAP